MRIDHHLQTSIIQKLATSDAPISYSELKQPEIENSLHSYHLNKLITQGLVGKIDEGYTLTVTGARWLNDNGAGIKSIEAPRVSIALVIENDDGEYLVGQRTGQFKTTINDYMLPSFYYENDADISSQIENIIAKFIPKDYLIERQEFGFSQISAIYKNKSIDGLFSVTRCLVRKFTPLQANPAATYEWLNDSQLEDIDHPSADLLRKILTYTADQKNLHTTPVFTGRFK